MNVVLRMAVVAMAAGALTFAACGGDDDGDSPDATPTRGIATVTGNTFTPVPAPEGTATLNGETLVSERSVPQTEIPAGELINAGVAQAENGTSIPMARIETSSLVEEWELLSFGTEGWLVWQPKVVLDVLDDAGDGATVQSVEPVDWPDACLGAAGPDEVCAEVITPGYRIILDVGGETVEYHASRAGEFRTL
jgi:hypothetical protein